MRNLAIRIRRALWGNATDTLVAESSSLRTKEFGRSTIYTALTTTATVLTDVINRSGRGIITSITVRDIDGLAQNEFIRITVDGNVVIDDLGADMANAVGQAPRIEATIQNTALLVASVGADPNMATGLFAMHYNTSIRVEVRRAAAGTTGLRTVVSEERIN